MIAKIPTIAAMCHKYSIGQPFVYPRNDLTYAENFLHMMFAVPCEPYKVNPVLAKALDRIFILHADHEQNASTSTVRLVGSTGASPYAAIAAGIAALWGPAHGGANEAVVKMLGEIGSTDSIPEFIAKAKDKDSHSRLMGFGHRVYKNYDPRAGVLKESADEVLDLLGQKNNPKLAIAKELERIALNDEYFAQRKLFPNVDFYSGIILEAMGIPTTMFTAIFALARTVGWMAQWNEMIEDPEQKIGRPRQRYTGHPQRAYLPIGGAADAGSAEHDLGDELGLGGERAGDQGAAAELPHAQLVAQDGDLDPELIAGSHGAAEPGAVDAHEVDRVPLVAGAQAGHRRARRRSAPCTRSAARPA